MKLLALSVLLSALQAVEARDPACRPAAPSCRWVSPWTARECSAIIHSHHIRVSTCEAPEKTITKTVVVTHHPTFTHVKTVKPAPSTKTSTKVITRTDPVTQKETTTAWATATAVSTTTEVTSDTTTTTATTTSVETETDSTTITATQDVTTTVSWAPEVCTPAPTLAPTLAPSKRSGHDDYRIPRDCSCFLTSTKSCGPRATKVVTRVEEAYPRFVTKTVTDRRSPPTVTITQTSMTHINGAPPPMQTVTSTTTSTATTTATSTSTVEETTTATEATTTTVVETATVTTTHPVTATEDPCSSANLNKYLLPGPPSSPNVALGFTTDGNNNASICCQNCHNNADCVFWKLSADGRTCSGYFTRPSTPVEGCTTNMCRRGHPLMTVNPQSDGSTYGMSNCGRFAVAF